VLCWVKVNQKGLGVQARENFERKRGIRKAPYNHLKINRLQTGCAGGKDRQKGRGGRKLRWRRHTLAKGKGLHKKGTHCSALRRPLRNFFHSQGGGVHRVGGRGHLQRDQVRGGGKNSTGEE